MLNLQQTNMLPLQTGSKGAVLAGQEYSFLLLCLSLRLLLCLIMEPSSVLVLSEDVLTLLPHNMNLLDLCACDKCLQRVKREEYTGKFNI